LCTGDEKGNGTLERLGHRFQTTTKKKGGKGVVRKTERGERRGKRISVRRPAILID